MFPWSIFSLIFDFGFAYAVVPCSSMHPFEELVANRFLAATELSRTETVKILIALSGGPDSVSLLMALKGGLPNAKIFACHVNHGLRGVASDNDAQFCLELCQSLGVPFDIVNLNLAVNEKLQTGEEQLQVSEEQLRKLRYQALMQVARKLMVPYVVSGHTLNDQVETMLFRLCRGTSIHGLAGMQAVRPLSDMHIDIDIDQQVTLVRPMLDLERAAIEDYLQKTGSTARFDQSNDDNNYTRNFLRLDIIPLLQERFPGLIGNMAHLQVLCRQEDHFLNQLADNELSTERGPGLSVERLQAMHIALRRRVICQLLRINRIEPSFARVERVLAAVNEKQESRQSLGDGFDLSIKHALLNILPGAELDAGANEVEQARLRLSPVALVLPQDGKTKITVVPWMNKALKIESLALANSSDNVLRSFPHRQSLSALLDLSKVQGSLTFRPRQDGDIIQPLGMHEPVRLKQYLHANRDIQVPAQILLKQLNDTLAQRLTPVLADCKEVLWVPGYGLSEKVRVQSGATHVISLLNLVLDINSEKSGFC